MGELGALFNPGMRHELEERRSKAMRREEEGNARDGDLRIDLESGVAVIAARDDEESAEAADAGGGSSSDASGDGTGHDENAEAADTADVAGGATGDGPSSDASGAGTGTSTGTDEAAVSAAEQAPPVLRPRGKRGLTATRR